MAERQPEERPVVAGFGPSGMFAGLVLAESGLKPLIIERGRPVEKRSKDVQAYFETGIPDPESNVQYGEGGAGTFSDGKLTTRIKDERIHKVLAELIEAGADPAIAYQARPHLGTDRLQVIVRKIRENWTIWKQKTEDCRPSLPAVKGSRHPCAFCVWATVLPTHMKCWNGAVSASYPRISRPVSGWNIPRN